MITTQLQDLPFDIDAPVSEAIERLSYVDLRQLHDEIDGDWTRSSRAHLRYLAALFPDLGLPALARTLFDVLDNRNLSIHDMRAVLAGCHLVDTSRATREVPLAAIQTVGRVLINGGAQTEAARASGVSIDTVRAIDTFLGLSQSYNDRLLDTAIAAVREGWTVREMASVSGAPKSTAHRYMVRAREVLAELGELS